MYRRTVFFGTILLLVLIGVLSADTIPGGDVSGTWYQVNSPYYINGDITIPAGDTLTIEPGVLVNFLGTYSLTAEGFLEAIGTETDSIHFFPNDSMNAWMGILLNDTSMGYTYPMSYCTFRRMVGGIWQNASASNAIISNCLFSRCLNGIFWQPVQEVDLQVADCVFQHGFMSAIRTSSGSGLLEINGCLFENHEGLPNSHPVIWATDQTGTLSIVDCIFNNNEAQNDGGVAIHCSSCDTVVIENCLFAGNINSGANYVAGGGAIFLSNTDASISRCLFHDNDCPLGPLGDAIMICRPGSWTIDHCTFWGYVPSGNEVNIYVMGDYDTLSSLTLSNSIFTDAIFNLEIQNPLTLFVEYSDFFGNFSNIGGMTPPGFGVLDRVNYNGDSCDCYSNIFMDPIFADTANRDFHLTEFSPCIDAGDSVFPYDPDSTITDMGVYYYHQTRPQIQIPLSLLDFGTVAVGDSSSLSLTIYNIGDADLNIYDMTNSLAVFTNDWDPADSIILPGDSLLVSVTFSPDDSITFTDTLWIDNNDTLSYVELAGIGEPPSGIMVDIPGLGTPRLELVCSNPFRDRIEIRLLGDWEMGEKEARKLKIYDACGRLVLSRLLVARTSYLGADLSPGIYFVGIGDSPKQKLVKIR